MDREEAMDNTDNGNEETETNANGADSTSGEAANQPEATGTGSSSVSLSGHLGLPVPPSSLGSFLSSFRPSVPSGDQAQVTGAHGAVKRPPETEPGPAMQPARRRRRMTGPRPQTRIQRMRAARRGLPRERILRNGRFAGNGRKPPNPFLLFCRELVRDRLPGQDVPSIGRRAGYRWRNMSAAERAPYQRQYQQLLINFLRNRNLYNEARNRQIVNEQNARLRLAGLPVPEPRPAQNGRPARPIFRRRRRRVAQAIVQVQADPARRTDDNDDNRNPKSN